MQVRTRLFYNLTFPLSLILLGIFLYSHTLHSPFQFDDYLTIVENSAIKHLDQIGNIWQFDPSRFLTYLSFACNYHWGGLKVFGYHAVNLILHIIVGLILGIFLSQVLEKLSRDNLPLKEKKPICLLAALLFLAHPVQSQAAIYVSERSTLLAALFYLLTLVFYTSYRTQGRLWLYGLSLLTAFLGIFTKPTIITLPFALLLCEIFYFGLPQANENKRFFRIWPFFLIVIAVPTLLILWKYKALEIGHFAAITRETVKITRHDYFLTQLNVMMTYFRLLVLPVRLNLDYDYPIAKTLLQFPTAISFIALIAVLIFAFRAFRAHKILSFGIFWFFLTLSLESSVFPISDVIFEHRLYLPVIGFVLIVSVYGRKFIRSQTAYFLLMASLIGVFSFVTIERGKVWDDRIGFLEDVAKKSPRKARVHNNLAIAYHDKEDYVNAEKEYKTAMALKNDFAHPHNNLANIYMIQGKVKEALSELETAQKIEPRYGAPYFNLGNVYKKLGETGKAKENFRRALEINYVFAPAHSGLGHVYLEEGDLRLARFHFQEAIRLDPDYAHGYYGLGDVYLNEGQFELAIQEYQRAITKKPDLVSAYNNIGNIYDMHRFYSEAIRYYRSAIRINPQFANAYFNLANTLKKIGQHEESARMLSLAREIYKNEGNREMAGLSEERLQGLLR